MTLPLQKISSALSERSGNSVADTSNPETWFDLADCSARKPPAFDAAETGREIELVVVAGRLSRNDRILDLCCGSGRYSLALAHQGFDNIVGLDRCRTLITAARRRAQSADVRIRFREGDARYIGEKPASIDAVLMLGGSFGRFVEPGENLSVLIAIRRVLKSRGRLVMDFTDKEWLCQNIDRRSWEWIDRACFACREYALAGDGETLLSREIHVHSTRGVIADKTKAERLYSAATLLRRLADAGFENPSLCGTIANQGDGRTGVRSGAPRFFVTAHAPAKTLAVI